MSPAREYEFAAQTWQLDAPIEGPNEPGGQLVHPDEPPVGPRQLLAHEQYVPLGHLVMEPELQSEPDQKYPGAYRLQSLHCTPTSSSRADDGKVCVWLQPL